MASQMSPKRQISMSGAKGGSSSCGAQPYKKGGSVKKGDKKK